MWYSLYIFSERGVTKILCQSVQRLNETINIMVRFGNKKENMLTINERGRICFPGLGIV